MLRPGGRVGVSTWRRSQAEDLGDVLRDLGLPVQREAGWIAEPEALRALLERAGFREVDVRADDAVFQFRDLGDYLAAVQGTRPGRDYAALDADQAGRVQSALAERFRPYERSDGLHLSATALLAVGTR